MTPPDAPFAHPLPAAPLALWVPASPLGLPRLIMRGAVVVALLGLLVGALAGLWRMQANVAEELQAARTLAGLAERLALLPGLDDAQALRTLHQWQTEGELRHLSLHLTDGQGRSLLAGGRDEEDTPLPVLLAWVTHWLPAPQPFTVGWRLPRPDGSTWNVALSAHPDSEQREAGYFVLEGLLILGGVAVGMLLVMRWNVRRALAPLDALLGAIHQLGQGRSQPLHDLPPMPVAELAAVSQALRVLAQALAQAEAEQRRLAQQLISLQDDERQRLARELHDELGQHLTALRVDAAWLLRQTAAQPALHTVVQGMAEQLGRIQQEIRLLLNRLRPWPVATEQTPDAPGTTPTQRLASLTQALHELVQGWQRVPGVATRFALDLTHTDPTGATEAPLPWPPQPAPALPPELMRTLYRISQEALTNIARHARAGQARLSLHWQAPATPDAPGHLLWQVEDDGVGLPDLGAALRRGNGLAGLKERIWAQGAELEHGPVHAGAIQPGLRLAARWALPPRHEPSAEPTSPAP